MNNIDREFPDFNKASLPIIPQDWEDVSWHNDCCPSWRKGDCVVFIEHIDPSERECDLPRFIVNHADLYETLFMSDDWRAVLDFVANYKKS